MKILTITLLLVVSCGDANFNTSSATRRSGYSSVGSGEQLPYVENDSASYTPSEPFEIGNDANAGYGNPKQPGVGNDFDSSNPDSLCTTTSNKLQKLTINFVVDVSGTMADEIDLLKDRMAAFVALFERDKSVDVTFSIVTFVDGLRYRSYQVSGALVTSLIKKIEADAPNKDFPEAGLGAINWARKYQDNSKNAKNFFILITDNVMHYGGEENVAVERNCNVSSLKSVLDRDPNAHVLAWGSSGRSFPPCGGYRSTFEQIRDLDSGSGKHRFMGTQFDENGLMNGIRAAVSTYLKDTCR